MLLSIVIPAYNAEKSIQKTIESVLKNNSNWFEVIVVNDGSTDDTLHICRSIAECDGRLHVIDTNNGGVSRARNIGIAAAQGDYVTFLDADDEFSNDWASIVYSAVNELADDVYIFGYRICETDKDKKDKEIIPFDRGRVELRLYYKQLIENTKMNYCWGKVYNLDFIKKHGIQFPGGVKIGEDVQFQIELLDKKPRITAINSVLVNYNQVSSSVMHTFSETKFSDLEQDYYFRKRLLDKIENDPQTQKVMFNELAGILLSYLRQYTQLNGEVVPVLESINTKQFYTETVKKASFTKKHPERVIILMLLRLRFYRVVEAVFKMAGH